MAMNGNYCDACGREKATVHVSMHVELFSTSSRRVKVVQFWLCEKCELNNRIFLENRLGREGRVARAITPQPEWMKAEAL